MDDGLNTISQKSVTTARGFQSRSFDSVTCRGLLPRVGDDNPERRKHGTQRYQNRRQKVNPRTNPVPAENQDAQKSGFEGEGEDSFGGQCTTENVADVAGVNRPVGAKFKLHYNAGGDADTENERKNPDPKPGQFFINFVFCF
jgi:hypothetical protein